MFTLENESLKVTIKLKGAELDSIHNKLNKIDYLWSGDATYWGKKSPVLFPIVGSLKNNTSFVNDKSLHLTRHGFARDAEFFVTEESNDAITLSLESNEDTLQVYPFHFRFDITYTLKDSTLSVTYLVRNTGDDDLFFSVGGHPAFKLPLDESMTYGDYYLEFNKKETAGRWPINDEGLIETRSTPLLNASNHLQLSRELFYQDAVVLKGLQSHKVLLKADNSAVGLELDFTGFPYLGLWAAKGADFLCIEPWCGVTDTAATDQQFASKEGINHLLPAETFERTWAVTVF